MSHFTSNKNIQYPKEEPVWSKGCCVHPALSHGSFFWKTHLQHRENRNSSKQFNLTPSLFADFQERTHSHFTVCRHKAHLHRVLPNPPTEDVGERWGLNISCQRWPLLQHRNWSVRASWLLSSQSTVSAFSEHKFAGCERPRLHGSNLVVLPLFVQQPKEQNREPDTPPSSFALPNLAGFVSQNLQED